MKRLNLLPGISLSRFSALPGPARAVLMALAGGSLFAVAALALKGDRKAMLILALGMVAVILCMTLYKYIVGYFRASKANPLAQGITGNAAAAPQAISEPARRARLDDLRRNFEQGVEKFRAAGKNLYSVPWYVLVGEPGSGKTEAIRHCNVGFPPGLQDQLQGAGGTLNMNWWFTNQAIILDTAGRLMFEEVAPGSTNEWAEFLKLLKTNRPNSPLNGIILVIPVDTLIKDSADSIEKKAGKIAQQFDQIQRSLGVRFPVFIIITKCDLLNGFREFFDDMNDPQLQHQIMGWSNPAPLDEKFDPKAVTAHMETVKKRLIDRRQQLLLDPINSEDAQARRIDQVDALYALPDSLTEITPRLRRYLEMVFVAGEWSPKPLFLRGIYFTSSMTEGTALDIELAKVLGVPVDSLPEGRVWRRDRAYFLRDLFIEKVFREKGLVTRADNADKQQRARRTVVMACGFVALLVLFVLTWLGSRTLERNIGSHRDFWVAAAEPLPSKMEVVNKEDGAYRYNDQTVLKLNKNEISVARLIGPNLPTMQKTIEVPFIFRPMSFLSGDINAKRADAYRALFERTILQPLYIATRAKIADLAALKAADKDGKHAYWSDDATLALAQLMKLEYPLASTAPLDDPHRQVDVDALFRFVLPPDDYDKKARPDEEDLQKAADWVYVNTPKAWPPRLLEPGSLISLRTIDDGVKKTIEYWKGQVTEKNAHMNDISALRKALGDFRDADVELQKLKREVFKLVDYEEFNKHWAEHYSQLSKASAAASASWKAAAGDSPADSTTLTSLYIDARERARAGAQKAYNDLLKITPVEPVDVNKANESAKVLASARQKLQSALNELTDWKNDPAAKDELKELAALDGYLALIKTAGDKASRRFEIETDLYRIADQKLPKTSAPVEGALATLDNDVNDACDEIVKRGGSTELLAKSGELAQAAIQIGGRYRRYALCNTALSSMPTNTEDWEKRIAERAVPTTRPKVSLLVADSDTFQAKFCPEAFGAYSDVVVIIDKLCKEPQKLLDAPKITERSSQVKRSLDDYREKYRNYWQKDVFNEVRFISKNWKEFSAGLGRVKQEMISAELEKYVICAQNALRIEDSVAAGALGRDRPEVDECKQVLIHWRDVDENYPQARRTILAMDPNAFFENYVIASAKQLRGFPGWYWSNLAPAAVDAIANDSEKEIEAGLKELARYERFPLAPLVDKKPDLTVQEVLSARAALELIKGATTANLADGTRSIGHGDLTKDKEVNTALNRLRGMKSIMDKQLYLQRLEKFLAALPQDKKTLPVTITVIKDKERLITNKYTYMNIFQGKKKLCEAYFQGDNVDQAVVDYPGDDLLLLFYQITTKDIGQTDTFAGPWAPFRLLANPNVKATRNGSVWNVEYSVQDPRSRKSYPLLLQLKFEAEVPDLKDWPDPAAR